LTFSNSGLKFIVLGFDRAFNLIYLISTVDKPLQDYEAARF